MTIPDPPAPPLYVCPTMLVVAPPPPPPVLATPVPPVALTPAIPPPKKMLVPDVGVNPPAGFTVSYTLFAAKSGEPPHPPPEYADSVPVIEDCSPRAPFV